MQSEGTQTLGGDRRGKRAAVMVADMVEFSRRMEQDQVGSADQVTRSIQLFRNLIGDYGGRVANITGDGILALFDSAGEALRFAIQIQTEFREQSVWGDGEPIEFRIGLNIGEVTLQESVAYGHCINVAARLQALADPSSILVSGAFRSAMGELPGTSLAFARPAAAQEHFRADRSVRGRALGREAVAPRRRAPRAAAGRTGPPSDDRGPGADQSLRRSPQRPSLRGHRRGYHRQPRPVPQPDGDRAALGLPVQPEQPIPPRRSRSRLGVRYILSGSLRRADKRLRIAVELIDAASETALWSDRFNLELEDLFDMQDEIAGAVASRLSSQIDMAERRQESPHPRDMRAYGLVVRGRHLILKFTKEANWHARRLFEEAIEFAPEYGRAFSALSRTHNLDWRYAWSATPQDSLESAIVLARRAKEFDRLDAHGFAELGYAKLYSKQLEEALVEYAQAMALNPNDSDIIAEYADALVYAEQPQRSVELLEKAMRLNPFYPDWYLWYLADAYDALGRYEDVVAAVQRMHDPSEGRRLQAIGYAHLGMMKEAQAAAREVLRLHPGFTIGQWIQRPPFRQGPVLERYVEGLRKAGLPE